uniref:Threonylcarbamoyl-AMP synthase n=1 Tax=Phallusia mammillata TaxID=59560 RepID=A0A6F9DY90_9ASCI|nr:yrdC domain-containing protein, mitochondrial [Phallusia mammillata]
MHNRIGIYWTYVLQKSTSFRPFKSQHSGKMMASIFTNSNKDTMDGSEIPAKTIKPETKFFELSEKNDNSDVIEQLVTILHKGGIIGVPTDTVYGLACLAQSTEAVEKLYALKERNSLKPIAICVGEAYDVCQWTRFPQGLRDSVSKKLDDNMSQLRPNSPSILQQLLNDLLPGPVTVVTERGPGLNTNLNPKTSLVGVRVPDYDFIRNLTNRLREPLALTSANISGEETSLCINDFKVLWPRLDAVVDGGEVGQKYVNKQLNYAKKGSTVIQILQDGSSFKILRAGCAYDQTVHTLQDKWELKLVV